MFLPASPPRPALALEASSSRSLFILSAEEIKKKKKNLSIQMTVCCFCGQFASASCSLCFPSRFPETANCGGRRPFGKISPASNRRISIAVAVRASVVNSHETPSEFVKRTEQAWLISQQPGPITCSSCGSKGHTECKWCRGTGFFIIGDNMLCEVPSRNTTCVICAGKGTTSCLDCKGTGFRAKWLTHPPSTSS